MIEKSRHTGIELLRIVCMLMILNLHSFKPELKFSIFNFQLLTALDYFRESLCICAVNVFIFISGFFSIKWKGRSFFSLIFQIYFWIFLIYVILLCCGKLDFNIKQFLLRINCLPKAYWFIFDYLLLYFISPILNVFVEKANKKQLLKFLLVCFAIQLYSEVVHCEEFNRGYSVLHFCNIYLLGRYINVYKPRFFDCSKFIWVGYYFLLSIIITVGALVIQTFVVVNAFATYWGYYNNPIIVCQAVCLFGIFKNIKLDNKLINWIAGSSLAVYLFHQHPDVKQWYYLYTDDLYDLSIQMHLYKLVVLFILIFFVAILIDKFRVISYNQISNFFNNKCKI